MSAPVTPREAEALAIALVGKYMTDCGGSPPEHFSNCLMMLCSVAGITMASLCGRDDAAARLAGTAQFVQQNGPKNPQQIVPIQ